ncbi:glycoside hydrolase family 2 [Streptomyces lunaelactis]|uniref:PA14 domain-containing protein n=1 Tax=Streptomyces lunaelactis TaxID=1535768 RepID=UPI0015858569|nr:PA14 domain-containing protein [Streptomyces lunaelactis]NUK10657.1 glycoside hydrolase family 2 [Streptomyces lunaelactis]NUK33404.1 glycoside hydrolase family 2 [Streptomyces lunaelactis]NUK39982.1 glycoside hydrolase family 2 [Streptomyces lunaelactis]NUK60225.1 glycoside hydrolase family 2 [Streptomyces lunaelactis]NUK94386.1 glycoside hydrolase family 2 [Streptomyces lunaelactis]
MQRAATLPHEGGSVRLRRRLALLLAALLGLAGLAAIPAASAADDPVQPHGLKGEYYTQSAPGAFDFAELKATGFDPNIDFGNLEPRLAAATGRADDVSVRWTGKIVPQTTGAHTFTITGDNGFRLWIDGKLAIDHWVDDWDREQTSQPVELTADHAYEFKVEYFEHYGGSNLHLNWIRPGQAKEAVPQSAFRLPDGFEYDGAIAATVLADGRTLRLGFAQKLAAPPAGLTGHLEAVIGGAKWPLGTVKADPADARSLLVELKEPVVGNKRGNATGPADVRYDGAGGLTGENGKAVGAFWSSGPNRSTYELRTRWADDITPGNAHREYPRPQLTRDAWQNLNGSWQFAAAEAGEQPPVGRTLGERILVPYPVESQLSGIERHEDRMWYRRTFTVPAGWKIGDGRRLQLNFGGVDWQSEVYVNGTKVTEHKGGYDKFSADITSALKPGRTQELIVGVYDPTDAADGENPPIGKQRLDPSGIWYTPSSGIWQTVWMEPVAADHADSLKLTPDITGEKLAVEVRGVRDGVPVTATAYDGGRKVGTATGRTGAPLSVPVPDPHLWSADDPHLYQLKVTVGSDRVGSYFGMRSIAVEKVNGTPRTVLNGKPVFLMATLDQGFWPDGLHTAPTDEALAYDLRTHKQLGFNSVRKHIKVEPDRWFYWADRLGLLVWQDMPSMNTVNPSAASRAEYEHEMKRMIDQHSSHPSVVMWVTFNEGWGQYDQARIADQAKAWDPTRLVNNMSGLNCCGAVDGGNGDIADAHGYPSPQLPEPDGRRALVSGEYGGLGLAVPGHAWSVQMSYVDVDPAGYTDGYLARLGDVRRLMCQGGNGAVYTQISDVEGELNGVMTYDRKVLKLDAKRVKAAHDALIRDASNPVPTGCPAP